ncbi:MAG: hypothetical protein HY590_01020 [Candidatus Omnitrophica bacterium]|nr:hypothetical protein [Candidatus Omnitrophota bacterium]
MTQKGFTPLEMKSLTGFTLIELILAIILFAGATVPLLLALNQGLFATTYSEHRQIAVGLALNELEDVERDAGQNCGRWDRVRNAAKAPIADFPTFQRQIVVSNPPGTDTNLKEVRVIVYWTDQVENSATLVTYFVNNPNGCP